MSGINGDKARFHRERKQKLARRERMQKFLKGLAASAPPGRFRIQRETKGDGSMTTSSFLSLPLSSPLPSPIKKKRVLLVDASPVSRDLRAEAMRKLGMDVDCACDISEARSWWRADLYNLVLINLENELGNRDKFCDDIRGATPPQQLAFLVGKPGLLADSPNADGVSIVSNGDSVLPDEVTVALPSALSANQPIRWGILAASKRISEVRSVFAARSKAMRNRPTPPRDLEIRDSRRPGIEFLMGLQKEEMQ